MVSPAPWGNTGVREEKNPFSNGLGTGPPALVLPRITITKTTASVAAIPGHGQRYRDGQADRRGIAPKDQEQRAGIANKGAEPSVDDHGEDGTQERRVASEHKKHAKQGLVEPTDRPKQAPEQARTDRRSNRDEHNGEELDRPG